MKKKLLQLAIAASLVTGGALIPNAGTSHADSMGCYGWFDYVYKSTHDVNFAYYHFLVCRGEAVARQLAVKPAPINTFAPIDGNGTLAPSSKAFVPLATTP